MRWPLNTGENALSATKIGQPTTPRSPNFGDEAIISTSNMWPAGTKVVCIDDHFPAWAKQMYAALPKAGNTYTIRGSTVGVGYGAGFSDRQEGEIAVYLREIVNPKSGKAPFREWGFKAERFRPLEEDLDTNVEERPESEPAEAEKELVPAGL
jgi:hypothetical protein